MDRGLTDRGLTYRELARCMLLVGPRYDSDFLTGRDFGDNHADWVAFEEGTLLAGARRGWRARGEAPWAWRCMRGGIQAATTAMAVAIAHWSRSKFVMAVCAVGRRPVSSVCKRASWNCTEV